MSCTPGDLLNLASCFNCLTQPQLEAIQTYLLCQIQSSGGTGGSLPSGAIVLWSGTLATIPSGWALCDGTNGTPNLLNRMIICADRDTAGAPTTSVSGTNLSTGGSALHMHGVSLTAAASPTMKVDVQGVIDIQASDVNHTHAVIGNTANASTLAPFYALAYIMKL